MRRAARTDANHRALLQALRQCGWSVVSTHALGGFVDAVACRRGVVVLLEFKQGKGTLTASQQRLLDDGWPIRVVRTVDDVAALH
ncbi:MAG: hypothetical protein OEW98_00135 [Betaproteobacteria bacterium]|nr:hypothetical protein [Betaproteobacteria bacterium]